jgi:Tfp pilus assembly protein PilF
LTLHFLFRRSAGIALRIAIAAACCLGIWSSWRFAAADWLFHADTEESVRAAIGLAPDGWEYYMRLAQFDRDHARQLLETALRLNRYNAEADIELGLQYEAEGDFDRAEKLLLEAYAVDHTYLPRWSLANYYFRRDNMPEFWAWARRAAEMPADDIGPLFDLCWRVSPDTEKITGAILNGKPELIRQYVSFLMTKDQLRTVALVAPHLFDAGDPESDRPMLLAAVNRLVASNDAATATGLWRLLIEHHWVAADAAVPNNGEFRRAPLPVGFDWSLPEYSGLHSWPGPSGLEVEFTGSQPEECTIAEQSVSLTPGDYTMAFAYRTSEIAPGTGVQWQIVDPRSDTVLAHSPDLSSEVLNRSTLPFTAPPGAGLLRLRLEYHRALGTPRISGMLVILSTRIQAHQKS